MSRTMIGKVVSNKMDKSVIVLVETFKTHPLYKKRYAKTARFAAHDEGNACKTGDVVEITESRPISRTKRFVVSKIVERAEAS